MSRKNYSEFSNKRVRENTNEIQNGGDCVTDIPDVPVSADEPVEEVTAIVAAAGVVSGCKSLNVRKGPNTNSLVLCTIPENSEVEVRVDLSESDDFYAVVTASGVEGFCMKRFIRIK